MAPASEGSGARGSLHVAIIMDGNGRWATARGLPRTAGHRAGVRTARAIVEASAYCNTHPAEMIDVMSSYTTIDKATFADMTKPQFALDLDPKSMQPIVNAAAKYNVIPRPFNIGDMIFR